MALFDNLVKDENTFTELFKNYLKYESFKEAFLELITLDFPKNEVSFSHFSTQYGTENGRPDIVISNNTTKIFIEIKVSNTKLTPNQPVGYLKELEKSIESYKGLVLLIPEDYENEDEYESRKIEYPSQIQTQTLTWTTVLKKFNTEENSKEALLNEFIKLLKEWFEPKPIIINQQFADIMFNSNTPKSLESLTSLIDQVHKKLLGKESLSDFKKDILDEYGFYYSQNAEFTFYFGVWYYYWKLKGQPLIISVQTKNKDIKKLFYKTVEELGFSKPELEIESKQHISQIILDISTDKYDVKDLVSKLEQLITKLN